MTAKTYTPEEQAQNRKKWAAALRSGGYRQIAFQLADSTGGFCCLGVACEVAKAEGAIAYYSGIDGATPPEVQNFFGIDDAGGLLRNVDDENTLVGLNDVELWPFDRIADLIDAEDSPLWVEK